MRRHLCKLFRHKWAIGVTIWPFENTWYVYCMRCGRRTVTVPGWPFSE